MSELGAGSLNGLMLSAGRWLARLLLVCCSFAASGQTVTAINGSSCAGTRFGSTLGCTAGEFTASVTISKAPSAPSTCASGSYIQLDGTISLSGSNADRYDIGFFTGEDGNDAKANDSSKTCSVATFPNSPNPWRNYDGDSCGDYQAGGVSSPLVQNLRVKCQTNVADGQLVVPYVVAYSQNSANVCTGPDNVVPGSSSKCNAGNATVSGIYVLPSLSISDGLASINSGSIATYTITVSNTSGANMTGMTLADPAVTGVSMSNVTCSASGGAACPSVSVPGLQSGISIASLPAGGTLTFTVTATLSGSAGTVVTNTANLTRAGQALSASDNTTILAWPSVSIAAASSNEGNSGSSNLAFTVTQNTTSSATTTVNYSLADGTAVGGAACGVGVDYINTGGSVTINPGATTASIQVPICGDAAYEVNETFTVSLTGATNATLGATTASAGTITNDDALPTVSVAASAAAAEGNSGSANIAFTLTQSVASGVTTTINYSLENGTAVGGAACGPGIDYVNTGGSVMIGSGVTSASILVPICGDTTYEANETFTVKLTGATNANLGATTASIGTITNDDSVPTVAVVASASANEDNSGTTNLSLTVTQSATSGLTTTVNYSLADGTAVGGAVCGAGVDYINTGGSVTINPGPTTASILVPICGDTTYEANETLTVTLTGATNAALGATTVSAGTITNDDAAPTISVAASASASEGNSGSANLTFTVTQSAASGAVTTVSYSLADGTAVGGAACGAGIDYINTGGSVTINPGTTTASIQVPICGDTIFEANETFTVTLSGPTNANVGTATSTGTIINDDSQPSLSVADVEVAEGNSGSVSLIFPITLSAPSGLVTTVSYVAAGGLAAKGAACGGGVDYVLADGVLSFPAGQTSANIVATVCGDALYEVDETFTLTLSAPSNASVAGAGTAYGKIRDDDSAPTLSVASSSANENTGTLSFTVIQSAVTGVATVINYSLSGGNAVGGASCAAGVDYINTGGAVSILAGSQTATISIALCDDSAYEGDEAFLLTLDSAVGASGLPVSTTATIRENDALPVINVAAAVSAVEGDSGITPLVVTVTLDAPSFQAISFNYATAAGTATAGTDYQTASGTVTIPAGQATATFTVNVVGDTESEVNESFTINLSSPTNATFAGGALTKVVSVTIRDDDLLLDLRMDTNWNDASGNGYNATATAATLASGAPGPAYASGTDTSCGYGNFNQSTSPRPYLALPGGFPSLNEEFTVVAWIHSVNVAAAGQRIVARDDTNDGWALTLSDDGAGKLSFFNRGVTFGVPSGGSVGSGGIALATPAVIQDGTWYFVAVSVDISASTVVLRVYDASGSLLATTSAGYGGVWSVGSGATTVGGESAGSAQNGLNFKGYLDELKVYRGALDASKIASLRVPVPRLCTVYLRLKHDGSASVCAREPVVVEAWQDPTFTVPFAPDVSVTLASGTWWDAASGGASGSILTVSNGSATRYLERLTTGPLSLAVNTSTPAATAVSCLDTNAGSSSCALTWGSSSFVIDEDISNQVAGSNVVVAGRPHDLRVRLVRWDGVSPPPTGCGVDTSYSGSQNVTTALVPNGLHPSGATAPAVSGVSLSAPAVLALSFSNGVASFNLDTSDVGRFALSFSDTAYGSGVSGSSAELTVRPFGLAVLPAPAQAAGVTTATAANGGSSTGRAGEPFATTIKAVQWVSADDVDNNGIPDAGADLSDNAVTARFSAALPLTASNVVPVLVAGDPGLAEVDTSAGAWSGGTWSGNLSFGNVGAFTLEAGPLSSYLGTSLSLPAGVSNAVGRFRPHHFGISDPLLVGGCGSAPSMTYVGQPFTIGFRVKALNAGGSVATNYGRAGYAPLATGSANVLLASKGTDVFNSIAPSGTVLPNEAATPAVLQVLTSGWGDGVFAYPGGSGQTDSFSLQRTTTVGPFDDMQIGMRFVDTSGDNVEYWAADTMVPVCASTGSCVGELGKTNMRYGRVRATNAFGSALLPLSLPLRAEYWAGASLQWRPNTQDVCAKSITVPTAGAGLAFGAPITGKNELAAGEVVADVGGAITGAVGLPFAAGVSSILLRSPSSATSGPGKTNYGFVELDFAPAAGWGWPAWLPAASASGRAKATFGLYKGSDRIIYRREVR